MAATTLVWRGFESKEEAQAFTNGVAYAMPSSVTVGSVREYRHKFYAVLSDTNPREVCVPPPWAADREKCCSARGMCEVISSTYHVLEYVDDLGNLQQPAPREEDPIARFIASAIADIYDQHPARRNTAIPVERVNEVCHHVVAYIKAGVDDLCRIANVLDTVATEAKEGS